MSGIGESLGVQSYCFRGFKENAKVAEMVRALNLSAIELCGVHADFGNEEQFESVIETYRAAGVEIVSIGVQGLKDDKKVEEKWFKFAQAAGAKFMSVTFALDKTPKVYRTAEKLADKYDIRLAIHNHGGRHWLGSAEILAHVFQNTSERIGLCLDTAWALDSGEDPVALVERFADRLYGLHFKDFTFDAARKHKDVVVGTGNLNLKNLFANLNKANFDGYAVLEYEGDVNNPVPALADCVKAVRAAAKR